MSKVGGKGLFVKEIQHELLKKYRYGNTLAERRTKCNSGRFNIRLYPDRELPFDAYISKTHTPLSQLPEGSIIGTSSLRRGAQILSKYPNLEIKWIRGNIDTRLEKLQTEDYDAIILAAAGLRRMGWSDDIVTSYLDRDTLLPAIGQGALGIECRSDDEELLTLLSKST